MSMKKRYKFRLQKNSLKEEKDNLTTQNQNSNNNSNKSPQDAPSASSAPPVNASSPVSSMSSASSSSSSSSPSSPSFTPSQSTPSPTGDINLNANSNQTDNSPQNNGPSSPVNMPQTNSNFNMITAHLIKPIDRTFLETVHEEDSNNAIETSNDSNRKSVVSSVSVQSFESTAKEETSSANKCQLYEQLSQLKPLKSPSFKSTTSICLNQTLNGESPMTTTPADTSNQSKVVSSSVTITPNRSNPVLKNMDAPNESAVPSKIPVNNSSLLRNGQYYRVTDYSKSLPLKNGTLTKFSERKDQNEQPLLTSSMELSCKSIVDSNDLSQNGSLNDLARVKTSVQSSVIMPRRNSALIPTISTNLASSRRVSVSDL